MDSTNFDFARCMRPDGSIYGSRGKCRKGSETVEAKPKVAKEGKPLKGQALANAMMQYANIENRVRANNKGSLATKKAKAELAAQLQKEGVPTKDKLREMALAQREAEPGSKARAKVKELRVLKRRLSQLGKEMESAGSKKELARIRKEIETIRDKVKG